MTEQAVPTTAEIYSWNEAAFGRGIAQNYSMIICEEIAEVIDVLASRDAGVPPSEYLPPLAVELADVMIACHAFAGFEGFELSHGYADAHEGTLTVLERQLVIDGGQLLRAVLKRAQGIRGSEQTWSARAQYAAHRLVKVCASLARAHGLAYPDLIVSRWAQVSTRDHSGHRPADETPTPGGLGYAPEQIDAIMAAGEAQSQRVAAREPSLREGHTVNVRVEVDGDPFSPRSVGSGRLSVRRSSIGANVWTVTLPRWPTVMGPEPDAAAVDVAADHALTRALGRMFDALRDARNGREEGSLAQYVCDVLARESDDHADVRGIVSRAGRKIAALHGAIDVMRDQLARAVALDAVEGEDIQARWLRALDRARLLRETAQAVARAAEHVGTVPR